MGGSKAPSSSSTTSTNLPEWLRPYAENFIKTYASQAFVDPGAGDYSVKPGDPGLQQQLAGFNPAQLASQNSIMSMSGPAQGFANAAGAENQRTLQGDYLMPGANPYLDATFNAASAGITNQFRDATLPGVMAAAQRAGQFGSSAMNETMGNAAGSFQRGLNDLGANIYGGNYQNERNRQMQALGMAPGTLSNMYAPAYQLGAVGAQQQQQEQAGMDTSYINAVQQAEYPYSVLSGFGSALGQAGGGSGSSMTTTKGSASGGGLFGK